MRGLCGNNETDDNDESSKWLEITEKIKIEYDETLDYHPQFEGYVFGAEVKQADTILIGYPLMHPMKESTRRNDLNFYLNVTRKNGPAMTHSMFAINYLDIGDLTDANEMLERSFKPYIQTPFNVWFEIINGAEGDFAGNFITGAGGFLQTIFNGFFGIRVHLKFLEIKKPNLPGSSKSMRFKGLKYLNSIIEIKVGKNSTELKFIKLKDDLDLVIDSDEALVVEENFTCELVYFCELSY
jgi:trehalose/maltose hydrolase-like predicted phosphorylase